MAPDSRGNLRGKCDTCGPGVCIEFEREGSSIKCAFCNHSPVEHELIEALPAGPDEELVTHDDTASHCTETMIHCKVTDTSTSTKEVEPSPEPSLQDLSELDRIIEQQAEDEARRKKFAQGHKTNWPKIPEHFGENRTFNPKWKRRKPPPGSSRDARNPVKGIQPRSPYRCRSPIKSVRSSPTKGNKYVNDKIRVGATFKSFEELDAAVKDYGSKNYVQVTRNTTSSEYANARLPKDRLKYPKHLRFSHVVYKCIHSGKPRKQGSGIRPIQSSFRKSCPFTIKCQVDRKDEVFRIAFLEPSHNHYCAEQLYNSYPQQRRLNPMQEKVAQDLKKQNIAPSAIASYFRSKDSNCHITSRDIRNIRQNKTTSRDEELLKVIEDTIKEDPDADIFINIGEQHIINFIYIQTSLMKEVYTKFPEVLVMDCTYKIDNLNMHCASLLCLDNHGEGRPVAHCILTHENQETYKAMLDHFVQNNSLAITSLASILVDKDFAEIRAIQTCLPGVRIALCLWHVQCAINRKIRAEHLSEDRTEQLTKQVKRMIYAPTEEHFKTQLSLFNSMTEDLIKFKEYFKRHWLTCIPEWALHARQDMTNFGQRTTNTIESFHQKLKLSLSSSSSIARCLRTLIEFSKKKAEDRQRAAIAQSGKITYSLLDSSPITNSLLNLFTKYAATIMIKQFTEAKTMTKWNIKRGSSDASATVSTSGKSYTINFAPIFNCTCLFNTNHNMICRHGFKYLLSTEQSTIPTTWIIPRWRKESPPTQQVHAISQSLPNLSPVKPCSLHDSNESINNNINNNNSDDNIDDKASDNKTTNSVSMSTPQHSQLSLSQLSNCTVVGPDDMEEDTIIKTKPVVVRKPPRKRKKSQAPQNHQKKIKKEVHILPCKEKEIFESGQLDISLPHPIETFVQRLKWKEIENAMGMVGESGRLSNFLNIDYNPSSSLEAEMLIYEDMRQKVFEVLMHRKENQEKKIPSIVLFTVANIIVFAYTKQLSLRQSSETVLPVPISPQTTLQSLKIPSNWDHDFRKRRFSIDIGVNIRENEIRECQNGAELYDNVINCFLAIMEQEMNTSNNFLLRVLPTHVGNMLINDEMPDFFISVPLRRYKYIVAPIGDGRHWYLLLATVTIKEVAILDSLPNTPEARARRHHIYSQWIKYLSLREEKTKDLSASGWALSTVRADAQTDSTSCGVHTLLNAAAAVRGLNLDVLRPVHIPLFRSFIVKKILDYMKEPSAHCDMSQCRMKDRKWTQCSHCHRWAHNLCAYIGTIPAEDFWMCPVCKMPENESGDQIETAACFE